MKLTPEMQFNINPVQVLVEGVKIALAMAQTQAFTRMGTKFWDEIPIPGCEHTDLWSDEYWTCMCRQYTTTIYHHSGATTYITCTYCSYCPIVSGIAKMGPPSDPESVVNHELKVIDKATMFQFYYIPIVIVPIQIMVFCLNQLQKCL